MASGIVASGQYCRKGRGRRVGERRLGPGRAKSWDEGLCGRGRAEECVRGVDVEVPVDRCVVGGTEWEYVYILLGGEGWRS